MTTEELIKLFLDEDIRPGKFNELPNKRASRPDLHAFLLLNELVPGDFDMVSAAEHDQIWLEVSLEALAPVITPEQVSELLACGVWVDNDVESLTMFV